MTNDYSADFFLTRNYSFKAQKISPMALAKIFLWISFNTGYSYFKCFDTISDIFKKGNLLHF